MRNKIYYDIFETETHLEYHTSASRDEVVKRQSMNRRIRLDHASVEHYREAYQADADRYEAIHIHQYK